MSESPLTEVNPLSLDELFSADPNTLTDTERLKIVETLRAKRNLWLSEQAAGKTRSTAGAVRAKKAPKTELSLDDLDFS